MVLVLSLSDGEYVVPRERWENYPHTTPDTSWLKLETVGYKSGWLQDRVKEVTALERPPRAGVVMAWRWPKREKCEHTEWVSERRIKDAYNMLTCTTCGFHTTELLT